MAPLLSRGVQSSRDVTYDKGRNQSSIAHLSHDLYVSIEFNQVCWKLQFYIQSVFKAPLCITLTISDQKIVSCSLFLTPKKISQFFFIEQLFIADAIK